MHEGHRERLRQIYTENGIDGLHDHQVLELILTYALPRMDTNPIAHRLLERYGSLRAVFEASVEDLTKIKGIGTRTAVLIKLAGDAGRRAARCEAEKVKIKNSADAMQYAMTLFEDKRYEAVYLLSLNKAREVIHTDKISSGTVTQTAVYPRLIVECAIRHGACSAILVHNHPSGDLTPSTQDIAVTREILNALALIDVKLDDHIIASRTNAYSCLHNCFLVTDDEQEQEQNQKLQA